jgi:hypothetical protein
MDESTSLGALLSGIFSGAYGLNQLFGSGSSSASGAAAAGAAAASPFQSQFGNYQPQIQGQLNVQEGTAGNYEAALNSIIAQLQGINPTVNAGNGNAQAVQGVTSAMNPFISNIANLNPNVSGPGAAQLGSPQALASQLNALSTNYMSNPAIQAQYQLGLSAVNTGQAASGTLGSGAQDVALEQYGQQYASNAYQQQYSDILGANQQAFGQLSTNTSQTQAAQEGTFGQGLSRAQGVIGGFQTQAGNELNLAQFLSGEQQQGISNQAGLLGSAGSLTNAGASTNANTNQGILNSLLTASGATVGSPATAGSILSGQFANSQAGAGNIAGGIGGIGSGLTGLLQSLLGGGGGGASGLAGLLGGLGTAASGTDLGSSLGLFSGGGGISDIFGSSSTDLSNLVGDTAGGTGVLGDVGSLLGGLF